MAIKRRSSKAASGNKRRRAPNTAVGIDKLPKDKPVVYKYLDKNGQNIYTGTAKKGRVKDRLKEHLQGGKDPVPGAVKIEVYTRRIQHSTMNAALKLELEADTLPG